MPAHLGPHPRKPLAAAVAVLLLVAGTEAGAEHGELHQYLRMDLSDLMAVEVTTPSLLGETVHSAPGSVAVITRAQIRDRGYRHLAQLLGDLPGIDIQNYSDGTTFNRIAFRGVTGNNKFLILQDGVRINSPTGEPIPVAGNFPLYHAQQVEVVFGPASAIYGADAFTGVVNIVTRDPATIGETELSVSVGEFGQQRFQLNGGYRLGEKLALAVGGHIERADNADLSDYYPVEFFDTSGRAGYHQPTRGHSLNARLTYGDELELGYNRSFFRNPTSAGNPPAAVDFGAGADYYTQLDTLYGRYRWALGGGFSADLLVDYSRYEVDPRAEFVNVFTGFQHLGYKYSEGERVKIEPHLTWSGDDHRVVVGASFEDIDSMPKTANLPRPYDGGPFFYPGTTLPIEIFATEYHNRGLFAQATSRWSDTVTTTVGARYDDNSVYGDSFTPRASVSYTPRERTTFELSYGESFLAPSPFYAYENYGSFLTDGSDISFFMHVPNPALQPEELKALELSVNHQFTDHLDLSAAIYRQRVKGLIAQNPTPSVVTDFVPGGTIYFTTHNDNLGTVEVDGLELSFNYIDRWGPRWGSPDVAWWGSYTHLDADLRLQAGAGSIPAPFTAEQSVKSGITFNWNNRWVLSPRLRWIGESYGGEDIWGSRGSGPTDDHLVVDLHAEARNLLPGLDLTLGVDNLFDRRYYNAGDGGRAFSSVPQDPRSIRLGLNYRF